MHINTQRTETQKYKKLLIHLSVQNDEWKRVQMLACGSDRLHLYILHEFWRFLGTNISVFYALTSALVKGTYYFLCQCNLSSVSQSLFLWWICVSCHFQLFGVFLYFCVSVLCVFMCILLVRFFCLHSTTSHTTHDSYYTPPSPPRTHTHLYHSPHIQTHQTHTHTNTHIQTHIQTHTYKHTHTDTHTYKYTHTDTHTSTTAHTPLPPRTLPIRHSTYIHIFRFASNLRSNMVCVY